MSNITCKNGTMSNLRSLLYDKMYITFSKCCYTKIKSRGFITKSKDRKEDVKHLRSV